MFPDAIVNCHINTCFGHIRVYHVYIADHSDRNVHTIVSIVQATGCCAFFERLFYGFNRLQPGQVRARSDNRVCKETLKRQPLFLALVFCKCLNEDSIVTVLRTRPCLNACSTDNLPHTRCRSPASMISMSILYFNCHQMQASHHDDGKRISKKRYCCWVSRIASRRAQSFGEERHAGSS